MSSSPSPSSPRSPATGTTRQLLDDLDALMQRMLALPMEQEDEAGTPPEQAEPAARADAGVLPVYAEPEQVHAARPVPPRVDVAPAPPVHPQPQAPAAVVALTVSAAAPVVSPESVPRADGPEPPEGPHNLTPLGAEVFSTLTAPSPFRPQPVLSPSRTTSAPWSTAQRRPSPRRLLLRPLYWTNRVFDRGTEWLGEPGRWLRGRRGRAVLGWTGVGLLAVALGWQVLAWLGWGW